jgi:uncharacterized repeat protein (TIGR01451 family)
MLKDSRFTSRLARRLLGISALLTVLAAVGCSSTPKAPSAPNLTANVSSQSKFTHGETGAQYTVTVSNAAGSAATSGTVTVTDPDVGITFTGVSGTGWTCTFSPTTWSCTRGDALAGGTSYPPIVVTGTVTAADGGTVSVSVSVSGGGAPATGSGSGSIAVSSPVLSITKTHTGSFLQGQSGATYTVTVSNGTAAGPTDGTTVTVTDTAPSGETLVTMAGTGWTCTVSPTCTRVDALAAGSSYPPITVTVNVAAGASSPQVNSVSVSGGGAATATITDSTVIVPPLLSITKTHTGSFLTGQLNATYTVTVSNGAGQATTSGTVTVTEAVPTGLTLVSMAGTGWNCTVSPTCTRADALAGGASYQAITVTVNVAASASTPQVNSVSVSGGGSVTASITDSTIIVPASLSITKTHTGSFNQGQLGATYTVTVSNAANKGVTNGTVTVTEAVPGGLTLVSMAGTGWTCTVSPTCTRTDALAGGASYPAITVTVNVAASAPTPQVNSVNVSGGGSATANTTDSTTILVPVLSITKSHTGNFNQGGTGAYTVTVSNAVAAGSTNGTTVTVTETAPSGEILGAMSGTGWTCTVSPTCTRSDVLAAGSSYPSITVNVTVASNAATPQINSVSVSGGGSVTANTTDSTIIVEPVLSISKTHTGNFTQGQLNATYTVTVSNTGLAATSGKVTVTDTVPSGETLVSMAGTGWTCPGTGGANTCDNATVLAASSSYPTITVTVNVGTAATSPQINNVSVSGGGSATANTTDTTVIAALNTCAGAGTGNESVLNGTYDVMMNGFRGNDSNGNGTPVAQVFSVTFDGTGKITIDTGGLGVGGEGDINTSTGHTHFLVYSTNAGSLYPGGSHYTVGSDNRACLQLVTGTTITTTTYRMALGGVGTRGAPSGVSSRGDIIEYDDASGTGAGTRTSGIVLRATPADFTITHLKADYALGMDGVNSALGHFNIVGYLPVTVGPSSATISGATVDWNNAGTLGTNLTNGSGTIGPMSATTGFATGSLSVGSGATAYSANWAIYPVNANELFAISTDTVSATKPIVVGRLMFTAPPGSFTAAGVAGGFMFQQTSAAFNGGPTLQADANIGVVTFTPNAAQTGTLAGTDFDYNVGSGLGSSSISGNFAISSSSGRISLTGSGSNPPNLYPVAPQSNTEQIAAFLASTGGDAQSGYAEALPAGVTFSNSSLSGAYTVGSRDPGDNTTVNITGSGTFGTPAGQIVITRDTSQISGLTTGGSSTFAFSINANGTGSAGTSTAAVTNGTDIFFLNGAAATPAEVRVFEK